MTKLGNYKLIKKIGTGGFSKVMLSEHLESGEKVALKIMGKSNSRSGVNKQKLFKIEVEALTELKHDNILALKDYSSSDSFVNSYGKTVNCCHMALEYAPNGEFFDYIAEGDKFSDKTVRFFFHKLIDTLEYMHENGYAHRDLKPENILFDSNFNLKLADFGFATKKETDSERRGTFGYMAPEVLIGSEYNPKLADLFSLGVILFIMATKHCPFVRAKEGDKYYNYIIKQDYDGFWRKHQTSKDGVVEYDDDLKDLISGLIAFNPEDRYSLEDIRDHPWFNSPKATERDISLEFKLRRKILVGCHETSDQKEDVEMAPETDSEAQAFENTREGDSDREEDQKVPATGQDKLFEGFSTKNITDGERNKKTKKVTKVKNAKNRGIHDSEMKNEEASSQKITDVKDRSEDNSEQISDYIRVLDGDILVSAVTSYCSTHQISFIKSKDFYRVNIEVGEGHQKTHIEVNILVRKKDGKRAVEFKPLSGSASLSYTIFQDFNKFLRGTLIELDN